MTKDFVYTGDPKDQEAINRWMDSVDQMMLELRKALDVNVKDTVDAPYTPPGPSTTTTTTTIGDTLNLLSNKVWYVFEDTTERDTFFTNNPELLVTDVLIAIKDTSPPPTPGVRSLDFSKAYNSQYFFLGFP